jgi:hypothetical protein
MLPFLNHLEGNKNSLMNILFLNFCIIKFLFVSNMYFKFPQELRKAIQEYPRTHDFVKRGGRSRRNKVQKLGS